MNLKELILFGMEESQEPVIKNPILQAALREPRPMTQGGPVGNPTGMITEYGRKVYETPGGEKVSEKSVTLQMGDTWINVPSIHGGKMYNQAQLEQMLINGKIQPTSTHNSEQEAVDAAMSRSDMMQSERLGFQSGQLVDHGPGRQGYKGDDTVVDRTVRRYQYDDSVKKKLKTLYKKNQKYEKIYNFRTPDAAKISKDKIKTRLNTFASEFKKITGRLPVAYEIRTFGVASQAVTTGKEYLIEGKNFMAQTDDMRKNMWRTREVPEIQTNIIEASKSEKYLKPDGTPNIKRLAKDFYPDKKLGDARIAVRRTLKRETDYVPKANKPGKITSAKQAKKNALEAIKIAQKKAGIPTTKQADQVIDKILSQNEIYQNMSIEDIAKDKDFLKRLRVQIDPATGAVDFNGYTKLDGNKKTIMNDLELAQHAKDRSIRYELFTPDHITPKATRMQNVGYPINLQATTYMENSQLTNGRTYLKKNPDGNWKPIDNYLSSKNLTIRGPEFKQKYGFKLPIKFNTETGTSNIVELSFKKTVPKTVKPTALQELMKRTGSGIDPILAGKAVVEETGSLLKKPMTKTIGKGIGKAFNLGLGPAGMGGLTYALKPEDGYDLSRAEDRIGFEAEAALAPTLVKGVASVTDKIKNPLLRKGLETLAGVRIPGIMNPTNALRIARIASPIGLASLAGEGLYHAGKKEMAKRKQMSPEELDAYMLEKQSRGWSKMSEGAYNQGGRVGLAKGSKGPKDPSKRLFIKGVAAASMIPILGKYFKLAKPAAKAVGQYTGPVIEKIKGLEWVQFLAKRLWDEGADVTETAARQEREIVRRGTLESGDDVDMVYNLDSGDVRFEVSPVKGSHQTSGGAYNDPYSLDYKAPQVIDEGKQAGTKIKSEIEVAESRPVQTDPETVELDGDYASVDDAFSDLTELEAFAKKKLTKEIHKAKGTKPKNVTPEYDPPDYPDIDYPDVDDFASGGRVSYFDGGIVGLKKKW